MSEDVFDVEGTHSQPEVMIAKPNPLKRFGCGILLIFWFTLLLSPCALFYLAANGEIRIWHSDIPEPQAHPRLLLELISEIDYRGLQLTRSYVSDGVDVNNICVQTDVSFFLWESIEENLNTSYCDCYSREDSGMNWVLERTITEVCPDE